MKVAGILARHTRAVRRAGSWDVDAKDVVIALREVRGPTVAHLPTVPELAVATNDSNVASNWVGGSRRACSHNHDRTSWCVVWVVVVLALVVLQAQVRSVVPRVEVLSKLVSVLPVLGWDAIVEVTSVDSAEAHRIDVVSHVGVALAIGRLAFGVLLGIVVQVLFVGGAVTAPRMGVQGAEREGHDEESRKHGWQRSCLEGAKSSVLDVVW